MSIPNYRTTFVRCLSTLKRLTAETDEYARFRWQAVYLTRDRFTYFFRGTIDGSNRGFFGQQVDLTDGSISSVPVRSVSLYGATFGLNETITAYCGPPKSVIDVAHAFHQASEMNYDAEFFYIRMNLLHSGNDSQMGLASDARLRENTNLIFVGLEDAATAHLLEESDMARWVTTEQPRVSNDWYAERFYYS